MTTSGPATKGDWLPLGRQIKASDLFPGGSLRGHIRRSTQVKQLVVHKQNSIGFIITDAKILVVYRSNVRRLEPLECPGNLWERKLNRIKRSIQQRQITNIYDLIAACGQEIEMKYAKLDWYL